MSERQVTMTYCPQCDQPAKPGWHTTVQCLDNMRSQRDEARAELRRLQATDPHRIARLLEEAREQDRTEFAERQRDSAEALEVTCKQRDEARSVSAGLLSHLEVAWAANRDMAQVIEAQRQEVTHAVKRFYPWLKEQATVDEEEG